ncbi:hypothetical protein [Streptomyces profundus]|nr:hypothetical protein [Streptomyces sp. MA3_2.13]
MAKEKKRDRSDESGRSERPREPARAEEPTEESRGRKRERKFGHN